MENGEPGVSDGGHRWHKAKVPAPSVAPHIESDPRQGQDRPKGKTQRQKFGYFLNRNAFQKAALQIECYHIQHAWDHTKSMWQNLVEMGLAMDPNKAVPFRKRKIKAREVSTEERSQELVQKPYVLNDLEAEASLPEKKGNTLSQDLIAWVRYMVKNHEEEYKVTAQD
ncbi:Nucleolar protein 16 [Myotis davidii]|uniref:Nucleolar protein 16 n=1 Tax=Myotis davidii TaxID=225400 RepID=L5LNM7_MYODS|nr:Nucleolar protein 16 [Myotis davidii]